VVGGFWRGVVDLGDSEGRAFATCWRWIVERAGLLPLTGAAKAP